MLFMQTLFLCGVLPVIATIMLEPRYSHNIDELDMAYEHHVHARELGVLSRKRGFDYTHLITREDGVTKLGSFDLGLKLPNDPLFSIPILNSGPAAGSLEASCRECFVSGIATASTTGFTTNDTLIENVIDATEQLITDPDGFLSSALAINIVVDLENVSAHIEVDINFNGTGSISVPIFHPITPLGGEIQGNEVGIIFTIDLVLTADAVLDFSAGFDVTFPAGAQFTFNPISGDLLSMKADGVQIAGIPFAFQGGASATFTVALRVGLKTGLGVNLLGTGFELETGIYVDVPTYSATITFDPTAECQLNFEEGFSGVAAAYAQIAASVDYIGWSAGPSTAVTFFTGELPGGCIASKTNLIGGVTSTLPSNSSVTVFTTSTVEHSRFVTTTTTQVTKTVPIPTSLANTTVGGMYITSPAFVVVLPTPVTGSFVSGTSVSSSTAGTTKQAIAPAAKLTPGLDAPTTTYKVPVPSNGQLIGDLNNSSTRSVSSTQKGFIGAEITSSPSTIRTDLNLVVSNGTAAKVPATGVLSEAAASSTILLSVNAASTSRLPMTRTAILFTAIAVILSL